MDARCRYSLILIVLFTALTGYGQNLRVTSLSVGAGGVSNAALHSSIIWPNTGLTNYFYWLEGGGRPALIAGYPGSPGGINAPKIFEVRRTGHPDNGLYIGSPGSGSMDGFDFINLRMQGSTDGNPDPRAVIAWSAAGDEEFGYRFREKAAEIIGGIGGHLWDMSDGVNLRLGTNTIPLRLAGNSVGVETNLLFKELAANETPPSGFGSFYFKSDSKPYAKGDGGTEYDLSAASAGGIATLNGTGTNTSFVNTKTNYITGLPSSTASSIYEKWFGYTNNANMALTAPFAMTVTAIAQAGSTRSNVVVSWGYNPMLDGSKLVSTEPSMTMTYETHYNPSGTPQVELYPRLDQMGTSTDWRPWMATLSTNGASRSFVINAGALTVMDNTSVNSLTAWSSFGGTLGDGGTITHVGNITQNARTGGAPSHRINDRGWIEMHNTAETVSYLLRPHADETSFILGVNSGSTHSGVMMDVALANAPTTVNLTADNQTVICTNKSYIRLSSDNGTAGNRTFVLTPTVAAMAGQELTIAWVGTNAGEIADDGSLTGGGNVRLSAVWTPTQYDTLTLKFNGTDWEEKGRSTN